MTVEIKITKKKISSTITEEDGSITIISQNKDDEILTIDQFPSNGGENQTIILDKEALLEAIVKMDLELIDDED